MNPHFVTVHKNEIRGKIQSATKDRLPLIGPPYQASTLGISGFGGVRVLALELCSVASPALKPTKLIARA